MPAAFIPLRTSRGPEAAHAHGARNAPEALASSGFEDGYGFKGTIGFTAGL